MYEGIHDHPRTPGGSRMMYPSLYSGEGDTSRHRDATTSTGYKQPPVIGATTQQRTEETKQRRRKKGCRTCYIITGIFAILIGIFLVLALAITGIVLSASSLSKTDNIDDELNDNCYVVKSIPGEDLISQLKGHICFHCGSGTIEAVIDYEFQQGSSAERFDLINTVLGMSAIVNGYEKISLCGNETAPLCPAFKPSCTSSCKWKGRLALTGENKTPVSTQTCEAIQNNPNMYTLFSGTDVAEIANIAQLN